jgi:hypothetical protein
LAVAAAVMLLQMAQMVVQVAAVELMKLVVMDWEGLAHLDKDMLVVMLMENILITLEEVVAEPVKLVTAGLCTPKVVLA